MAAIVVVSLSPHIARRVSTYARDIKHRRWFTNPNCGVTLSLYSTETRWGATRAAAATPVVVASILVATFVWNRPMATDSATKVSWTQAMPPR